jgi:Nif-specific regulatory protein
MFDLADKGSIFFDEIGNVPIETQAKLLRVIQERDFMRLGGMETIKVDVRIIAATNVDLRQMMEDGKFREDLFYRLHVITIQLPPLRDRKDDIPLLVHHFLEKYGEENKKGGLELTPDALDLLTEYDWPGNVRELENALERSVLVCDAQVIHGHHLPPSLQTAEGSGTVTRVSLKDAVEGFERDLIQDALKTTRGNRAKAARLLDTTERILNYKVRNLGVDVRRFRPTDAGRRMVRRADVDPSLMAEQAAAAE